MLTFDQLKGLASIGNEEEMKSLETEINDLARRLAAAYASHFAGYSGVDYLLKSEWMPEKPATVWLNLAEYLYKQRISPKTSRDDPEPSQ